MGVGDPVSGQAAGGIVAGVAAPAGLIFTALLWGAMTPMTHVLVTGVFDPFFLALVRYLVPAPLLLVFCLLLDRSSPFAGHMPVRRLFTLGVSMSGFSILFTVGLMLCDPIRGAIVMSCNPLMAAVLARTMYRMPFARGFKLAMLAAMIGGAMVAADAVRPKAGSETFGLPFVGEALLIGAMFSWNWYSMKAQEWLAPMGWSQIRISFLTSLAGCILMLAGFGCLSVFSESRLPTEWPTPLTWFMIGWLGFGGAGAAIVLWNFGVSRIGLPVASIYSSLAPVFAVGVAALFFGAPLSAQQLLGGVVVLAGIVRMQILRLRPVAASK